MNSDTKHEFAAQLRRLTGVPFEKAVTIAFQHTFSGFQPITSRSGGDGGLDGLSHQSTTAYFCFGPEPDHEPTMSDTNRRKYYTKKIVEKFCTDINRILEVRRPTANACLIPDPNKEIPKVLGEAPLNKITTIRCCTTQVHDKAMWGSLAKHLREAIEYSDRRFVSDDCEITLWGPDDIASNVRINQEVMLYAESPDLHSALQNLETHLPPPKGKDLTHYESKMDHLELSVPSIQKHRMPHIRSKYKIQWAKSLRLEDETKGVLPSLHRQIEVARMNAIDDVFVKASKQEQPKPADIIELFQSTMKAELKGSLPHALRHDNLCKKIADAELGRSIGECPLDWRPLE